MIKLGQNRFGAELYADTDSIEGFWAAMAVMDLQAVSRLGAFRTKSWTFV